MKLESDILVVGGGLVGLTAAFALASAGQSVILCAPKSAVEDPRTTALLNGSVDYLKSLGIWKELEAFAHPLKTMRLVDGTSRLVRFQQTDFRSSEIGLDAFGYNLKNAEYQKQLEAKLELLELVTLLDATLETIELGSDGGISATANDQAGKSYQLKTSFIVGADGKRSKVRHYFGHGVRDWQYPQHAIVLDFEHDINSGCISTEFHTENGPFTVVPQTSKRAGLVWLEDPVEVDKILARDTDTLSRLIEEKMGSYLGKVRIVSKPASFPMTGLTANRFGDTHHVLIGEAAHVFPPIGAQGFNLGIRDIEELTDCLRRFTSSENAGNQYHVKRSQDINTRTVGIDLLNRSLLSDFLPVQLARSAGMFALGNISPLRKQAMKMGISPAQNG